MKRFAALAALLCLFSGPAAAKAGGGGFGMFGPTVGFVDFTGLNATLGRYGFDKLGSLQLMMGGAGYGLIGRIVIGGGGWGGEQTVASESLNLRCRVSISGGEFQVGYSLITMEHLLVTPMLGLGGSGYDVALEPATGSVPNFDSLLLHPGRTSALSFSNFTASVQLGITIPISFVGLHLRGGYALTPGKPAWTLGDGATIVRGPEVAAGMPYASLYVAFGGFGRGKD